MNVFALLAVFAMQADPQAEPNEQLPLLRLEAGQSLEFLSRLDCETGDEDLKLNGATSSSRLNTGKKKVTFLFLKSSDAAAETNGVLIVEAYENGRTYMSEATSSNVPSLSDMPQAPLAIVIGQGHFFLMSSRNGRKNAAWDYDETQVGLHGATINYKGSCKLTSEVSAS